MIVSDGFLAKSDGACEASILDCKLRGGSYVLDFQLTREDAFVITEGLAEAGIRSVEFGHGLGLDAGKIKGRAAETDEDYIRAACAAAAAGGVAKVGCFFIPGISEKRHMHSAREAGFDFIRLGIDVDDYQKLEPFVNVAKSLGLEVWPNMIKNHTVSPSEFGVIAQNVEEMGVDIISIVDSAGGMTPNDVASFTAESLSRKNIPVGFRGHNDLTLAIVPLRRCDSSIVAHIEIGGYCA